MIKSKTIESFINLAQMIYEKNYYDLHNDYYCQKIIYESGRLKLIFKNTDDEIILDLTFNNVLITKLLFFNTNQIGELTIDNIYRGKVELNGKLIEFSDDERGYFYLDFYEGQKMEFWAESISLDQL